MTRLEAIIQPSRLERVKEALDHVWIAGLTVSEVKDCGPAGWHEEIRRGGGVVGDVVPKIKVEVVIPDPLAPRVVHELERAARTGSPGDGTIIVTRLDEAVRIRTGERGEAAL